MTDEPEPDQIAGKARGVAQASDSRILLWSGGVIALLVVIAVAFTFISEPEQLDPDTPGGVVQRYLRAVIAGDRSEARSYMSERLRSDCDMRFPLYLSDSAYRIEWLETTTEGTTAHVAVRVTEQQQGMFGDYRPEQHELSLDLSDGDWLITHQEWPWYECSEDRLKPEPG